MDKNLQSLRRSSYPVNIIVVDNKSTDTTVQIVRKYPEVQLLLSETNLGFGKANNLGIKTAMAQHADYVFLLNQDTWIFPNTIQNLVEAAEMHPEFGILSPLHFSADEKNLDANFQNYFNKKIRKISDNMVYVPFVNAAAWLIPRRVINKVGFFEPLFDHYGEDRNYVNRVLFHQFQVIVVENSKICHDRKIIRNFKKDVIQSKFTMLSEVLDVNHPLLMSYLRAFRAVFGLPKYFSKFYNFKQTLTLFFSLLLYYAWLKLKVIKIYKKRLSYRK